MTGSLLLADWGTTSRRAWLLDTAGRVTASVEDRRGLLSIEPGGWEAAFDELKRALGGGEPRMALLAGMVGADRGWRDAGYLPCPAGAEELAGGLCRLTPGPVAIVPGLSAIGERSADVMRGEETQVLGAFAAGLAPPDCFACHPGTHTKWIVASGGRVVTFRTVMTGELFALLRERSVLARQLEGAVETGADFDAGLERGLDGSELTADLFGVRADALLGAARIGNRAAYVSGLLIGADLRAGLALSEEREICVIGRSDLVGLYAAALGRAGRSARQIDGEAAVLAGLRHLAELAE